MMGLRPQWPEHPHSSCHSDVLAQDLDAGASRHHVSCLRPCVRFSLRRVPRAVVQGSPGCPGSLPSSAAGGKATGQPKPLGRDSSAARAEGPARPSRCGQRTDRRLSQDSGPGPTGNGKGVLKGNWGADRGYSGCLWAGVSMLPSGLVDAALTPCPLLPAGPRGEAGASAALPACVLLCAGPLHAKAEAEGRHPPRSRLRGPPAGLRAAPWAPSHARTPPFLLSGPLHIFSQRQGSQLTNLMVSPEGSPRPA